MMEELTSKQQAVLEFIEVRARQTGFRPSLEDVRRHFGFNSLNSVVVYVKTLERKGYLPQPDLIKGTPAPPSRPRRTSRSGSLSPRRRPQLPTTLASRLKGTP